MFGSALMLQTCTQVNNTEKGLTEKKENERKIERGSIQINRNVRIKADNNGGIEDSISFRYYRTRWR